ncbi:MAG: DUF4350 domain-containing protein, partial [Tannerella sp.]|nr:DUF4350 domain-containing protein [Tannerella sp.]
GKPVEPLPLEQRCGFLVTENSVGFAAVDVASLLRLLERGHKVMLCLNSFPQLLCDSLCFTEQHDRYYYSIDRYVRDGMGRDSLLFGTDSLSPEQVYLVYPQVHPIYFKEGYASSSSPLWDDDKLIKEEKKRIRCDSMETLVRNGQGEPVAMRLYMGAGELFLVGTPLMFTNYGLLDEGNASYPFRLLSYMKGLPVIRLEAYGIVEDVSHSPLRYLLIQPSLRWAVYMATVTLLLCMIFTARRRQRVIPVALPPANESLRFTQLIGNLYYQKKDCKDILSKKYLYFCAEVKRLNGPELQTGEPDMELSRRLAEKMGQDADSIWPGFRELKYLLRTDAPVTETDMMRNINRMNEWLGYLN